MNECILLSYTNINPRAVCVDGMQVLSTTVVLVHVLIEYGYDTSSCLAGALVGGSGQLAQKPRPKALHALAAMGTTWQWHGMAPLCSDRVVAVGLGSPRSRG